MNQEIAIERFFQDFERNSSSLDFPAIASQYADVFFAAGPQGAQCVRVTDFVNALQSRNKMLNSLGLESSTLASLKITEFSERYVMAQTQWQMTFVTESGSNLQVLADSLFIIDTAGEDLKIVFYLAGQDPTTILKNHDHPPSA